MPTLSPDTLKTLKDLDPVLKKRLFERARETPFYRDETLFQEGSDSATGYFLLDGWVKLTKSAPNGRCVIVDLVGPGDPLGLVAAYDSAPFPVTAIAVTSGRLLIVPRADIIVTADSSPIFAKQIFSVASARLRRSATTQTMLAAVKVEARLAQLCIDLLDRMQEAGSPPDILPKILTRREMAEMTGASAETVIRIFSRWAASGILVSEPGRLVVHDRKRLERLLTSSRRE